MILISGCVIDLILILDGSGSELPAFNRMIDISYQLVELLAISKRNAHVAQIRFANTKRSLIDYDFKRYYDKAEIIKAIKTTSLISGTTNVDQGLDLAIQLLSNPKYGSRPSKPI